MSNTSEMLDLFMIGDKLATVAKKLGILPRAMATSQVPLIEQMFPGIENLECTRCIMTSKRQVLYSAAKKIDVYRVSLEKDSELSPYWAGLNPAYIRDELEEKGFKTDIADFSNGIRQGIRETGEIYDKTREAERLIRSYDKKLEQSESSIIDCSGIRVAVILGMINPYSGEHYLIPEGSNSYLNREIVQKLGCTNISDKLMAPGEDQYTINDLSNLKEVCPDVIVLSGDAQAGLLSIFEAVKNDGGFQDIPAIKNHAVFCLPHLSGGNPVDYPWILQEWTKAFSKKLV